MLKIVVVGLTLALAGCASGNIRTEPVGSLSNRDLCIDDAVTRQYGPAFVLGDRRLDGPAIAAELTKRGETCQPTESYDALARTRVVAQKQAEADQAKQQAENLRQQRVNRPLEASCARAGPEGCSSR